MNIAQFLAMCCNLKIKSFQSGVDVGSLQQFARDAQHGVFCGVFQVNDVKSVGSWGSAPNPDGETYGTPPYPFSDCVEIPCGNPPSQILHTPLHPIMKCVHAVMFEDLLWCTCSDV